MCWFYCNKKFSSCVVKTYKVESSTIHTDTATASPNSDMQSNRHLSNLHACASGILVSHGSVHIHWTHWTYHCRAS